MQRRSLVHVVAPFHAAIGNGSLEVLINCFLAQSVGNWSLAVVSDGPSARAAEIVGKYGVSDARVAFSSTAAFAGDHGHTPRRAGLAASVGEWTLLTGSDNYYVPLLVESVRRHARPDVGLLYFDFVLDMKGEYDAGAAYDRALAAYEPSGRLAVAPFLDGAIRELAFEPTDDLPSLAAAFVREHRLSRGAGCDDADCVAGALVDAMRDAVRRASSPPVRPRALPPYSGHIDTDLDTQGDVDIGAFLVRTDLAQAVGFPWTHHAADFAYLRAVRAELARRGLRARKINQTLYVHN